MAHLLQKYSAALGPLFVGDLEPRSNHVPYLQHPQSQFVGYPTQANCLKGADAAGVTITAANADSMVALALAGDMRLASYQGVVGMTDEQTLVLLDYLAPRIVETDAFRLSFTEGVIAGFATSREWVAGGATAVALTVLADNANNSAFAL